MENPPWISIDSAGPCSLDTSSSEISSLLRSGLKTLLGHAALRVVNLNVRLCGVLNMKTCYIYVCVYLFIYTRIAIILYYIILYFIMLHYIMLYCIILCNIALYFLKKNVKYFIISYYTTLHIVWHDMNIIRYDIVLFLY